MTSSQARRLWVSIAILILSALACNVNIDTGAGASPTQPAYQLPTAIPAQSSPEALPVIPSEPPVEAPASPAPAEETLPANQFPAEIKEDVDHYYTQDYLPFKNGELHYLPDFEKTKPAYNVYDFTPIRQKAQNFALWADIELDTTGTTKYPEFTGCGFAYRVQNNSDGYIAFLTNDYVRMGACDSGLINCQLFGTFFGSGQVNIPNSYAARFSLAVNKDRATVLVDDVLIGRYNLFTSRLTGTGDLYYGAISNVNEGYWTSCKITNVMLWESLP